MMYSIFKKIKINYFSYDSLCEIFFNISSIFLMAIISYILVEAFLIKSDFILFIILMSSIFAYYLLFRRILYFPGLLLNVINALSVPKLPVDIYMTKRMRIGIFGPPDVGKTTLANRIVRDWTGDAMVSVPHIPHETQRARRREGVTIECKGSSVTLDIVDTPGLATKIDFHDFMAFGLTEEEAKRRAKEATEGVIEAVKWLDDLDGVILVMDATEDPYTQVNVVVIGNMEARKLPLLIAANKIDRPGSSPNKIQDAFPNHNLVPISALEGWNIDLLYKEIIAHFGK